MVDDHTLQVYDLPLPPYLAIDGGDRLRERRPRWALRRPRCWLSLPSM